MEPGKSTKQKNSVRFIISSCGSYLEIFSVYVDECLKTLVQNHLPTYIISSDQVVYTLAKNFTERLPPGAKLFSVDAIGMYSNIDRDRGIYAVRQFVKKYKDHTDEFRTSPVFISESLKLIMKNNVFQFGDTFWRQLNGTAMVTSCAVNYAFLYVRILEIEQLLKDF